LKISSFVILKIVRVSVDIGAHHWTNHHRSTDSSYEIWFTEKIDKSYQAYLEHIYLFAKIYRNN